MRRVEMVISDHYAEGRPDVILKGSEWEVHRVVIEGFHTPEKKYRGDRVRTKVVVRYCDETGAGRAADTRHVESYRIVLPWDEYAELRDEVRRRDAATEESNEMAKLRAETMLSIFRAHKITGISFSGPSYTKATVKADAMSKIAAKLETSS